LAKSRGIAGFQDVTDELNNNNDNNSNSDSIIKSVINDESVKAKIFKGIYFDEDVADALEKLVKANKGKKGIQSIIVNAAVKQALKNEGYL